MAVPDSPVVAFLHAHPDDEAIFTAGTMRRLADAGATVALVVATRGELGEAGRHGARSLAEHRADETAAAAELLGASIVRFLGHADSGLHLAAAAPASFARAGVEVAAAGLAEVLADLGATTVVTYDDNGVYGHPDHVMVHRVGHAAARRLGLPTVYDATVDREYLHFVETHVVEQAHRAIDLLSGTFDAEPPPDESGPEGSAGLGLAATPLGVPSVLVDLTVDVRAVLDVKRAAMAAHASQLPADSPALSLAPDVFAEVYGFEWYVRRGTAGPLDALA